MGIQTLEPTKAGYPVVFGYGLWNMLKPTNDRPINNNKSPKKSQQIGPLLFQRPSIQINPIFITLMSNIYIYI